LSSLGSQPFIRSVVNPKPLLVRQHSGVCGSSRLADFASVSFRYSVLGDAYGSNSTRAGTPSKQKQTGPEH
jgi:carbonic anhydrase/acetyltransferase-like protein (isoleucine patch superfamily)